MAEQLRHVGREVPLVVMLDAPMPRRGLRAGPKLKLRAQELWRFSWRDRYTWLKDQFRRRVGSLPGQDFGEAEGLVDTADMQLLLRIVEDVRSLLEATLRR
jgi:thioesterase domain-containing protein